MSASLSVNDRPAVEPTGEVLVGQLAVRLLDETLGRSGDVLLQGVTRALATALSVDYVLVCECAGNSGDSAVTLAAWMDGARVENFNFDLDAAPCGTAMRQGQYYCPSQVRRLYPEHAPLAELQVDGYFGVAIPGADGQPVGHLALMHREPLTLDPSLQAFILAQARFIGVELERRQAESPVREREQLFAAIADALPVCIAYVDADERYRFINQTYADWQCRSRESILGKKISDVVPADIYAQVQTEIAAALAGEPRHYLTAANFPDGQRREVEVDYLPFVDERQQAAGYFALTTDITERSRSERERQELFECFRAVTLAAFEGIAVLEEGRFVQVNDSYAGRLGCTPEELIGNSYEQFVSKESLPRIRQILDTRYQGVYEIVARSRNGKSFPAEICGVNVDVGGRHLRVSAARDISARVAREQAIAEAADQEKIRIGQDLHDSLGQDLTGVSLGLENLRRVLQADGREEAGQAAQLGQALKRSIQSVRSIARGLAPMLGEDEDLARALSRLADDVRQLHDIECLCNLTDSELLTDIDDATQVYRIAQEACANAVRHAQASRLELSTRCEQGVFHLTVSDNGAGLPEQPKRGGLGLRSMTSRARILAGSLSVASESQGGTTLSLSFPLRA